MKQSPLFRLNWQDVVKGLFMAIITPALFLIQQTIETGNLKFNWQTIGMAAVAGGLGYIVKNFVTPAAPTQTVTQTPNGKVTEMVIKTDQVDVNVKQQ